MKNISLAMVGYGSIAEYHVEALNALRDEGTRITWRSVVGRLPEPTAEFAAWHGFARQTTDLDEALADTGLDAVVVTSPTDLHFEHVEKCLLAGKHVLAEIPITTNLAQADRLTALAESRGLRLMVCHTQRYFPAFAMVRQMVAEGKLHVQHVMYRYSFFRRDTVNWTGRRRSWADNLLWHHGAHAVDTALWILGATDVSTASQVAPPSGPLGIPMDLGLVMRTPRGELVTVAMSYNDRMPVNSCLIIGEENTYRVEEGRLSTREGVLYAPDGDDATQRGAMLAQNREFLAAIAEGRRPAIDGAAVRPAMVVLQAAQDAAVP